MADQRLKDLEDQLKRIGCNFRFWGRAELRELANVLLPGEKLEHCVNGSYHGGFALLAATDQRLLLVDKKPMYLTLEDVRFDMITEIDYHHRLLNANVLINTPNKTLRFVGYNRDRSRRLFHFVQTRVGEIRQHYTMIQQQAPMEQPMQQPMQRPTQPQFAAQAMFSQQPQQTAALTNMPGPGAAGAGLQDSDIQQLPGPRMYQPQITHAAAYRTAVPVISAYTRLPLLSTQRRFLGSRAMNSPQPSMYR